MDISFKKTIEEKTSCEIHFISKKGKEFILSDSAKKVDELTEGAITNTITNNDANKIIFLTLFNTVKITVDNKKVHK